MRFRVVRVIQFAGPRARRTASGHEVFGIGEECELVPDGELTHDEAAALKGQERRQREADPDARIVPIRLGDQVRFLRVGTDVEAIPDEREATSSRPRTARSAARKPPDRR